MSPVQDVDPNISPTADGVWKFFREGDDVAVRGVQINSNGSITATGGVTAGAGAVAMPAGMWFPEDHGLVSWSNDPFAAASTVIAINQRIYVIRLPVRRSVTVDKLHWVVSTAGASPVAGQNQVGLYSAAGVRLASTNVDADISSSGAKETTITAQALTGGTFVYQAFLFNGATAPTLLRGSSLESSPSINLPTAQRRAAVVASAQTTLPASFDPATLTTTNCLTFFAALEAAA